MSSLKLLIVEDEEDVVNLIKRFLSKDEFRITHKGSIQAGLQELETTRPHLVLVDLNLPDGDGLDLLVEIKKRGYPCEVIIMTASGSVDNAVFAMRNGAFNFLEKPFSSDRLIISLHNAIEHLRLTNIVVDIQATERSEFHGFIGISPEMQLVYKTIQNCAKSNATVLVQGESGTGKEICASAIHQLSNRVREKYVPLNCAAIPKELVESEVFGHVRGAFSGATRDRIGAVSSADGGTLFLDEIGELNLDIQAKLLRFLQSSEVQKVGSNTLEKVDVRIICATNRDLLAAVKAGNFRGDLYYRLNVIQITLPPLIDRESDILLLSEHFLDIYSREEGKDFSGFAADVTGYFQAYPWPGNVRQLQNVIRNIVVLNQGKLVTMDMLPAEIVRPVDKYQITGRHRIQLHNRALKRPDRQDTKPKPLWQVEKDAIEQAIALCNGNIPQAAALLEVSPSTIYRKKLGWE